MLQVEENNMLAPVVVFVYRRLEHTRQTIASLMKNTLAKETDVYIFSDGFKGEFDREDVLSVRNYIQSLKSETPFRKLEIIESKKNNGLAKSVISGTSRIIKQYGKVINVEDDLLLSEYFLEYMNTALNFYEDEKKVWSIGSHAAKLPFMKDYKYDTFFCHRASSWGWGTWLDRWEKVDWSVSDYKRFKLNLKERKRFNIGGDDMASLLDRQMCGLKDSWAIRWCYAQYKDGSYCVRPVEPMLINIGQDGSGTHCTSNKYEGAIISKKSMWKLPIFFEDEEIEKEFCKSGHTNRIKLLGSFILFAVMNGRLYMKVKR